MIERESCYFCASPFQLFSILSLAIERKEEADLYISPQFSGASQFAGRIKKLSIFQNVKMIDLAKICKKYLNAGPGLKNHIQIANTYLHVNSISDMILLPNVKYKNLFAASKTYLPRMVQLSYIKRKWNFEFYYIDDGAGTYYRDRAYKIKKTDKIVRRLLFGRKATDIGYKRFVLAPELYKQLNMDSSNKIESISKCWETESGRKIMNSIFSASGEMVIDEKLIILDQPKDEILNISDIKSINNIYSLFVEKIGFDEVIIKRHPRSDEEKINNIKYLENIGIPFEIFCMNMNMDKKILVGYASTAVATPKILFGQEPKVIVLSRLFQTKAGEKDLFGDYFEAVKRTYTNPDNFCIPQNMEELIKIMSTL